MSGLVSRPVNSTPGRVECYFEGCWAVSVIVVFCSEMLALLRSSLMLCRSEARPPAFKSLRCESNKRFVQCVSGVRSLKLTVEQPVAVVVPAAGV
jgi:hypothetical protein